ncbi:uncharacterized protein LOC118348182 [Juglans regia]|uniref:Uncharacterized protein LOC118348182 n=1 Tax=Juglans regia TaxID=51240 RepID=A0A6P9EMG3_JUGRE|nr:uncharacterized protein LOC118348182 [Juglans regia]
MEEEISLLCKGLKLTEEEQQELHLTEEEFTLAQDISNLYLVALVISDRDVNKGAFKATMTRVWNTEGGITFKDLGSLAFKDIDFSLEPFWIQLHDLPFAAMNIRMGEKLGSRAGKVITVDVDEKGIAWGGALRVKVMFDLSKSLIRGCVINVGDARSWIPYKYERLPSFCYHCGIILHTQLRCSRQASDGSTQNTSPLQYGPWLRADSAQKPSHYRAHSSSSEGKATGSGRQASFDEQG